MIGGIIDSVMNVLTDKRDYNRQVSQYNQQYELQKDQFYRGMQYRVKDLKAAGLHPSLAAGMNASQVVSAPSTQPSGKQTNFAQIDQIKTAQKQRELIDAQIELTKAQANDIRTNTAIAGQVSTVHKQTAPGTQKIVNDTIPPVVPNTDRPKKQFGSPGAIQIAEDIWFKLKAGVPVETIENEYGELISLPYGVVKALRDLGYNINDRYEPGIRAHDALNRSIKRKYRRKSRGNLNRSYR